MVHTKKTIETPEYLFYTACVNDVLDEFLPIIFFNVS